MTAAPHPSNDEPIETEPSPEPEAPSGSKLLIEFGPLALFFLTNKLKGIIWATGVLMVAMAVSMAITWRRERKLSPMMIITGITVLIFGGLTIYLDDDRFIKIKVTIINALFGVILLGGVFLGRPLLKPLMGPAFRLTDEGWSKLSARYGLFFLFMAALNEVVWRSVELDTWVNFKVFGLMGLTLVFTFTQIPLLQRHELGASSGDGPPPDTNRA